MRPTTKRRVIILATSAVLGSLALGGVYQFRQYQINAKTTAYRAEGMERTALILVGPALDAAGFRDSALYSAGYDRRFRPGASDSER